MAKYLVFVTRTTIETASVEMEGDDETNWDATAIDYMNATPDSKFNWELDDITYEVDEEPTLIADDDDGGQ